jgi:hypothetical protein
MPETTPCSCSEYQNTTECKNNQLKQLRICDPVNCAINENWIDAPDFCALHPEQNYYYWNNQTTCLSKVPIGEKANCYFSLPIPSDCTNVTAQIRSYIDAESEKCNIGEGSYYIINRLPPSISGEQLCSWDCNLFNNTCNKTYSGFNSNMATGSSTGFVPTDCNCKGWFDKGITTFTLVSNLYVTCDRPCSLGWFCSGDYETYRLVDCSQNESSFCLYGCSLSSGRCNSGIPDPSENLDIFSWLLKLGNNAFPEFVKNIISFGVIGVVIVTIALEMKTAEGGIEWRIPLGVGLGLIAVFLVMKWLNPIIGVLWILSIAIIFMKSMFFKGD